MGELGPSSAASLCEYHPNTRSGGKLGEWRDTCKENGLSITPGIDRGSSRNEGPSEMQRKETGWRITVYFHRCWKNSAHFAHLPLHSPPLS